MQNDDPSPTLPTATQPTEEREIATIAPAETLPSTRVSACGARIRGSADAVCSAAPVEGRARCRLHGGLTPVGRASPHFRSGFRSGHPVPLTPTEAERYATYKSAVYDPRRDDLAGDIALMRLMLERSVSSGSSGVAEAGAVARLASTHARITEGRVIRLELDEARMGRFIDWWMAVVDRHVRAALGAVEGKRLVGEIALELQDGMKQLEAPPRGVS